MFWSMPHLQAAHSRISSVVPAKFPSTLEKLYAISGVWLGHGPQWKSEPAGGVAALAVALAATRSGYCWTRAAQNASGRGYVPVGAAGASPHAVSAGLGADWATTGSDSPAIATQRAISPARQLAFPARSAWAIHQPGRSPWRRMVIANSPAERDPGLPRGQ